MVATFLKAVILGGVVGSLMLFADAPSKQKPVYASFLGASIATSYLWIANQKTKLDKRQILQYLEQQKKHLSSRNDPDSQYELAALFAVEDRIKEELSDGTRAF